MLQLGGYKYNSTGSLPSCLNPHHPLVQPTIILGPLELNLETLHPNLESIHGLNSSLCTGGVIKADEAEAFALVGGSVNEDFGADDIAEGEKHLHELGVTELLGQVVDEEIAALRTTDGAS